MLPAVGRCVFDRQVNLHRRCGRWRH
jgi:hypothetical protein